MYRDNAKMPKYSRRYDDEFAPPPTKREIKKFLRYIKEVENTVDPAHTVRDGTWNPDHMGFTERLVDYFFFTIFWCGEHFLSAWYSIGARIGRVILWIFQPLCIILGILGERHARTVEAGEIERHAAQTVEAELVAQELLAEVENETRAERGKLKKAKKRTDKVPVLETVTVQIKSTTTKPKRKKKGAKGDTFSKVSGKAAAEEHDTRTKAAKGDNFSRANGQAAAEEEPYTKKKATNLDTFFRASGQVAEELDTALLPPVKPEQSRSQTSSNKSQQASKLRAHTEVCCYCSASDVALGAQCPRCASARYCNSACMAADWRESHANVCVAVERETVLHTDAIMGSSGHDLPKSMVEYRSSPPPDLLCPITKSLFDDPVFASDGEAYERATIERWIADKQAALHEAQRELEETGNSQRAKRVIAAGISSPMGHGMLENVVLVPARTVKRMASQWREENAIY